MVFVFPPCFDHPCLRYGFTCKIPLTASATVLGDTVPSNSVMTFPVNAYTALHLVLVSAMSPWFPRAERNFCHASFRVCSYRVSQTRASE